MLSSRNRHRLKGQVALIKKSVQELSPELLQKAFHSFSLISKGYKLCFQEAGLEWWLTIGVVFFKLAVVTEDLWEGGRYPSARTARGQATWGHQMAPDTCGQLNLAPRTQSFTDFNRTLIYDAWECSWMHYSELQHSIIKTCLLPKLHN